MYIHLKDYAKYEKKGNATLAVIMALREAKEHKDCHVIFENCEYYF